MRACAPPRPDASHAARELHSLGGRDAADDEDRPEREPDRDGLVEEDRADQATASGEIAYVYVTARVGPRPLSPRFQKM